MMYITWQVGCRGMQITVKQLDRYKEIEHNECFIRSQLLAHNLFVI